MAVKLGPVIHTGGGKLTIVDTGGADVLALVQGPGKRPRGTPEWARWNDQRTQRAEALARLINAALREAGGG